MQIANLLPQKITCILPLIVTCMISGQSLPQIDPPKDKASLQEKKSDEKRHDVAAQGGGIEVLSDTMGVDFGPYMRQLKVTVQGHWNALIPEVALPPLSKSGTVTIELAVMKDGHVRDMKLVKSSEVWQLDRAAWGGITNAIPLPTLPPEFKGDYLKLRCNFIYNPAAGAVIRSIPKTSNEQKFRPAIITTGTVEYLSNHEGLDGSYTKLILDAVQSSLQNLLQKAPPGSIKKSDQVAITFSILRNGAVKDIKLKRSSGDKSFDQIIWEAIRSSSPYQDLPEQFKGKLIKVRCEIDVP